MLTRRVIACLDVKDGVVVKGVRFRNHEILGDVLEFAARYSEEGADELVFYDITASSDGRKVSRQWIEQVARLISIPFCVAGGIRTIADAEEILHSGADKISINSPALERPELITEMAERFGSQCVVVGVDSRRDEGEWKVYQYTGDEKKTIQSKRRTLDWVKEAQSRGAGEIVLNCMDQDGTGLGYDIEQLSRARELLHIPLVASGGAKTVQHFVDAFEKAKVDAALAAGVFHRREILIPDLKQSLRKASQDHRQDYNWEVRL